MILQRYLMKEMTFTFLATLLILLLIIVGNTFVRLLNKVSEGNLPVDVLGKLVLIGSFNGSIQLIPIALLIGIMLTFGRLYQDHEMSALSAAGMGPRDFYKSIFRLVIPLTVLMAVLILFVLPRIEGLNQSIKLEVKQRPESAGIPQGEFLHSSSNDKEVTLFVERLDVDNVVMKHLFLNIRTKTKDSVILAEEAMLFIDPHSGERLLKINNGSRYEHHLETNEFMIFQFSEHGVRIPALEVTKRFNLDSVSMGGLWKNSDPEYQAEFHWRLAIILSAPIMAFLAFPLSFSSPRQGRYGKLALGIVLYAIYANLLVSGVSMIEDSVVPTWLGLWWVHALFIALSLLMIQRHYGIKTIKQ